jgi:hypothetical protein
LELGVGRQRDEEREKRKGKRKRKEEKGDKKLYESILQSKVLTAIGYLYNCNAGLIFPCNWWSYAVSLHSLSK